MAQAISRGITKAGVGVETVNLELDSTDQVMEVVKASKGFVIGSPTLGGHMPTQVQTALGALLREPTIQELPCGVFGSFGWSGEAVDEMEGRLKDAGFSFAFKPLRVKFKPTARDVQLCEESGTDLAQKVLRKVRAAEKQASSSTQATPGSNAVQQAVGRIVGALCVVTGKDEDAESSMLASWISQASFDPPGLSIAVKKDRAVEPLLVLGNNFIVNVLAQGNEKAAVKQMLKPFKPAEPRFEGLDVEKDEQTGCIILKDASAYVACTVKDRMDAGDHYVVYATVDGGKVLSDGVTSVHHRKSGITY
jgi:flavin reductase (DIM6/NTAB) family NADH-FMN oxidoreductase RutF